MNMVGDRDFDEWISNFKETIADYSYYVDFDKVVSNTNEIKIELNLLNSLIGSKNIEEEFRNLVKKYPMVVNCIPILLAVRSKEINLYENNSETSFIFDKPYLPLDYYVSFMKNIGLFDMISHHIVNNLVDYVMGVETGLDSNARKNRGGHAMEKLVESYIKKTGCRYEKEMCIADVQKKWGIDLSILSNQGKAVKRFDFVVESKGQIFAFEVNFYYGGGSKLNETARSYKMLAEESKLINKFKFVWITDGVGWKSAKGNLRETFEVMENIYCIHDLENGILNKILL